MRQAGAYLAEEMLEKLKQSGALEKLLPRHLDRLQILARKSGEKVITEVLLRYINAGDGGSPLTVDLSADPEAPTNIVTVRVDLPETHLNITYAVPRDIKR